MPVAFLSGCIGSNMRRWRQQPAMVCSLKATGFIYYPVPHFHACWLQSSRSVCQLLLPRLQRETIWHILYLPNHIIDVIQSSLNSVPTNFTGLQGTWQGLHTQQQEMVYMYPLHTQPHFSPSLPKMGRLPRPCCSELTFCDNLFGLKGSYSKCVNGNMLLLFPLTLPNASVKLWFAETLIRKEEFCMLSSWAFLDLIVILAFIFIEFVAKQIGVILQSKIDIILQAKRKCSSGKRAMIKITRFTPANISIIQQKLPVVMKTKIPYFHSTILISWVSEFSKTDWMTHFIYFLISFLEKVITLVSVQSSGSLLTATDFSKNRA